MSQHTTPMTNALGAEKADYATLRSDIDALRDDMKTLAKDARSFAAARGEKAMEKGREFAEEAGERVSAAKQTIEQQVRENPLAALGVAFGVGVLLASLTRR